MRRVRAVIWVSSSSEAVAVGLADQLWGEVVGLCVVAREPITSQELDSFCRERLSEFKLPKHIVFADELPRNAMGKVVRNLARKNFVLAAPAEPGSPAGSRLEHLQGSPLG